MSKKTFPIAFGGVISALCIVLEFSVGIFPVFLYVFPMICALLMNILLEECGLNVSLCAYTAVSIISLLICPDKEAALMYAVFFGYYPMARVCIHKLRSRLLRVIIKLSVFNAAIVCTYYLLIKLLGAEALGMVGGPWLWIGLLAVGNFVFALFDILLDRLLTIYNRKYRGKFSGGRRKQP